MANLWDRQSNETAKAFQAFKSVPHHRLYPAPPIANFQVSLLQRPRRERGQGGAPSTIG